MPSKPVLIPNTKWPNIMPACVRAKMLSDIRKKQGEAHADQVKDDHDYAVMLRWMGAS